MKREQAYLLYLIKCVIDQTEVRLPKEPFDWYELAEYAEEQQFEQILYPIFENKENRFSPETWFHLQQRYGLSITKDAEQEVELLEICTALSEREICHIPLKGQVIKKYYCYPEMRTSADFDILIHKDDRDVARDAVQSLGYKPELEFDADDIHDIYYKDKFNIELHKELCIKESPIYEMRNLVWDYCSKESGYTYALNDNFLYIYMLEHLRKHLIHSGGAGIKHVVDLYVLNLKLDLDNDEFDMLLEKAKMTNFNRCVQLLIKKWFYDEEIDDDDVFVMEKLILTSGAYGDFSMHVKMKYSEKETSSHMLDVVIKCFNRIFPGMKFMKKKYPILEKYPWLFPFMWCYRAIKSDKKTTKATFDAWKSTSTNESEILNNFKENISR